MAVSLSCSPASCQTAPGGTLCLSPFPPAPQLTLQPAVIWKELALLLGTFLWLTLIADPDPRPPHSPLSAAWGRLAEGNSPKSIHFMQLLKSGIKRYFYISVYL